MLFRYLVIQVLMGPTLRLARACLTCHTFTSHTSFPQQLIPPHSLPTTVQNIAQTYQKSRPLDLPDDILTEIRQNQNWYVDSSADSAVAIRDALQEYNLSQWGFVMFRCTYRSQEKWDKFVALAKGYAHEYFEECEMQTVHDRIQWTIIEDAAALDGADIVKTSRWFEE